MLTTCYYGVPLYERLVDIELLIVRVPAYYQKVGLSVKFISAIGAATGLSVKFISAIGAATEKFLIKISPNKFLQ
ncbi:hypothetical protein OUZ56_027995 [Daphnia magna]|uniref:Uncharacterized protein n=1 Tax=Daphnia magna TaxID=35525 RepID=A0ABR0B2J1_9CRUS|nr:hypothetical protein OUZ56_027995 [Daphnia magna]